MPATLDAPNASRSRDTAVVSGGGPDVQKRTVGGLHQFDEGEFQRYDDVPVFVEHSIIGPDNRQLTYGEHELQLIANRCNRRIAETGDYAVLCLGHTPTPEQKAQGMPVPPCVGFAGPFRVGRCGQDAASKACILATFWVFKDAVEEVKRHPRRSPEVWLEEDYADMFLDPIALLGAEPPRLDLGMLYSNAERNGHRVMRYSAVAAASPTSAFIPTDTAARRGYAAQPSGDFSMTSEPDDIVKQVVDAIAQLPAMVWAETKMKAEQQSSGLTDAEVAPGSGAAPAAAPSVPPTDAPPPAAPVVEPTPEPTATALTPEPTPGAADLSAAPPLDAPGDDDPLDDESRQKYGALDAALTGMEDEDIQRYMSHRRKSKSPKRYGADGEPSVQGTQTEREGDLGDVKVADSGMPEQYARSGDKLRVSAADQQLRYQLQETTKLLNAERSARIDSDRRQALTELRHAGVLVDVDKEMTRLCYSRVSDANLFRESYDAIAQHYQRVPMSGLPEGLIEIADPNFDPVQPGAMQRKREHSQEQRQHYSKQATQVCLRIRDAGGEPDFENVLKQLSAGASPDSIK